jgi:hypothetical protein
MKRINNSEDGCEEEERSKSNAAKSCECKKTAFSELKKLSTPMELYESCTHLKYKKLYNALSLINKSTVQLAAKFKLKNTGLISIIFNLPF